MCPSGDRFPPTRPSAIGGAASDDPAERARAFEILVRAYWKPVYKHVRLQWRRDAEDARDVTQGFFARAFEKRAFGAYDPARARFRTYLKGSLDKYVLELARDASRQKRGGGALAMSLDFDVAEDELARSGALERDPSTIEGYFDHEWTRSLFAAALAALEASCERQGKRVYYEVFRRYMLDPEGESERPSYADVAKACGVSVSDVTNYLSWTRREMRAKVLDQLREITANEEEMMEEARALGFAP
ncbi:MAG: sigma-70 family RNA polymerase sigma factor [Labilithrix sp.]|nr:sigma-70 family RNA polymerase sigma factor [Labilithrix sp.]